jgi:6-phosphofructo-2-kinase / fructose-2,6-biphosphatase 2
MNVWPVE